MFFFFVLERDGWFLETVDVSCALGRGREEGREGERNPKRFVGGCGCRAHWRDLFVLFVLFFLEKLEEMEKLVKVEGNEAKKRMRRKRNEKGLFAFCLFLFCFVFDFGVVVGVDIGVDVVIGRYC